MVRDDIWDLEISPDTESHIWRHGIAAEDVRSLVQGDDLIRRNRAGRAATHQMIARDRQGRCLTVPVLATDTPGTWRVITAWLCKAEDATALRRYRGR